MCDMQGNINCVVLLGPTASGKTRLAVRLARKYGWDIISVDSRQVYKGLDLASGKDLGEYIEGGAQIPCHLIDITTLDDEYNVFRFQNDFYALFDKMREGGKIPFAVGGTGLYLDCILRGYALIPVPENDALRRELEAKSLEELSAYLMELRPSLHNKSDLLIKERVIKAIQIELYKRTEEGKRAAAAAPARGPVTPLVLGVAIGREKLYRNIEIRLSERLKDGMIDEIANLHKTYSWERLEKLGLEGRYVSFYLEGKIASEEEMQERLATEIKHFAKRQETWFRKMEKSGVVIRWLPPAGDADERFEKACRLIDEALGAGC